MLTETDLHEIRVNRDAVELLLIAYQITRTRIAETADVSKVTVSKVLHNHGTVSREKQMAVLRAIAGLTGRDPEALVMGRLAASADTSSRRRRAA